MIKGVVDKSITQAAKRRLFDPTDHEREHEKNVAIASEVRLEILFGSLFARFWLSFLLTFGSHFAHVWVNFLLTLLHLWMPGHRPDQ